MDFEGKSKFFDTVHHFAPQIPMLPFFYLIVTWIAIVMFGASEARWTSVKLGIKAPQSRTIRFRAHGSLALWSCGQKYV